MYSDYLKDKKELMKKLVSLFADDYDYVSCLGSDIKGKSYRVNARQSQVNEVGVEAGGRLHNSVEIAEYVSVDSLRFKVQKLLELNDSVEAYNPVAYIYDFADVLRNQIRLVRCDGDGYVVVNAGAVKAVVKRYEVNMADAHLVKRVCGGKSGFIAVVDQENLCP